MSFRRSRGTPQNCAHGTPAGCSPSAWRSYGHAPRGGGAQGRAGTCSRPTEVLGNVCSSAPVPGVSFCSIYHFPWCKHSHAANFRPLTISPPLTSLPADRTTSSPAGTSPSQPLRGRLWLVSGRARAQPGFPMVAHVRKAGRHTLPALD